MASSAVPPADNDDSGMMADANRNDTFSKLAEQLLGVKLHDPEPSVDDVFSAFGNFSVSKSAIDVSQRSVTSKQKLHEIHFEVPAVSLLPHGATPSLPTPHGITRRECPRPSPYLDTRFTMRLGTNNNYAAQAEVPAMWIDGNDVESLRRHVDRLHGAPGISALGFVAYQDEHGVMQCRARLTTTWHTAAGRSAEIRTFDINAEDWFTLLTLENASDWPQMVDRIMQRCSDRAFFHVHERLQAFDYGMAVDQVEVWAKYWGTASLHTAKDFLKHRISWEGNSSLWEGKMPCGHMQAITPIALLEQMNEHEAGDFACDTCGVYALTPEDYEEVLTLRDRIDRVMSRFSQQTWKAVEKQASLAGH